MKSHIFYITAFVFGLFFVFSNNAQASILYSQSVTLSPGWNIVSTPKILESHSFSEGETSTNFDIYALDPSKTSGWATLSDLGQTEFAPLYGYFINNKTGSNQTLTFNYKADTSPSQRLFERTFSKTGWYSFGVANSSYVLPTDSPASTDTNNPFSVLSALVVGSTVFYDTVIDFTDALSSTKINSVALTDPWKAVVSSDINNLNDFRETKGYAIYIKSPGALYNGFQNNNIPACSDGIDNDNDSLIDMNDSGCSDPIDNSELPVGSILTVTNWEDGLVSTAKAGDSMAAILGFKVEAQSSDTAIQRVKLNLGINSSVYNKFYKKIYVTDGDGNVLISSDLNSSTVVKEGSNYFVTLSGFSYVVADGPENVKQMYIKVDLYNSIDTSVITNYSPQTITLADNGVRGVDGTGIDQYGPANGSDVTHAVNIVTVPNPAKLTVSLNPTTPKKNEVVCSSGSSENECDKLVTLVFDLKAEGDSVLVRDLSVDISKTGAGSAISPTAYIYDGSTELDSATITNGTASFTDLDYTIPKDTTKTLTVKIDIRNANPTISYFITSVSSDDMIAENSLGDPVTDKSGTATGNQIGIRNIGPEFNLVTKSITTAGVPQTSGINNQSTSTLTATFNVKTKAVGGDIMFGTVASTSPMFSKFTSFKVYRNGSEVDLGSNNGVSISYTIPTSCVTSGINSCVLAEGSEVTIPVTFQIQGRNIDGSPLSSGLYSVGLEAIYWVANGATDVSNFMSGESDWRTADVSFP